MKISYLQGRLGSHRFKDKNSVLLKLCNMRDLIKGVRKKKDSKRAVKEALVLCFRIAQTYDFKLNYELARRFPGHCSYCVGRPCFCHTLTQKPRLRLLEIPPHWWPTLTLSGFQQDQGEVYPKPAGNLEDVLHFAEECLELIEVFLLSVLSREKVIEETCDLFEHAVCVARSVGINCEDLFITPQK